MHPSRLLQPSRLQLASSEVSTLVTRAERWDMKIIWQYFFQQLAPLKWMTFLHQVDMRMIFDELKRDMREAMEEKRETRSICQLKSYWRFSRGSPISPRWSCPVYFASKSSSHTNIQTPYLCTLSCMCRTVWPEVEEEDGSDFNIKQPSSYSLYKYRLWKVWRREPAWEICNLFQKFAILHFFLSLPFR